LRQSASSQKAFIQANGWPEEVKTQGVMGNDGRGLSLKDTTLV
jgi:hypothetical protein